MVCEHDSIVKFKVFDIDLATIVESLTLGAESNNCITELGNTSFTNMEMGPTSITDITKPYPAKEPLPESSAHEVSIHKYLKIK